MTKNYFRIRTDPNLIANTVKFNKKELMIYSIKGLRVVELHQNNTPVFLYVSSNMIESAARQPFPAENPDCVVGKMLLTFSNTLETTGSLLIDLRSV